MVTWRDTFASISLDFSILFYLAGPVTPNSVFSDAPVSLDNKRSCQSKCDIGVYYEKYQIFNHLNCIKPILWCQIISAMIWWTVWNWFDHKISSTERDVQMEPNRLILSLKMFIKWGTRHILSFATSLSYLWYFMWVLQ